MKQMQAYHVLNLLGWLAGFGVIIWQAGIWSAIGLFVVLWTTVRAINAKAVEQKLRDAAEEYQARLEQEHIRSDPQRFGTDPTRKRYM